MSMLSAREFRDFDAGETNLNGPLVGVRVVEFGGIGPCPFAAMMLSDHGAEVIRIDRHGVPPAINPAADIVGRDRRAIVLDLKHAEGTAAARAIVRGADIIVEGFRPGVMERLGLGPAVLLADTPALVYGRMTGWGQTGPLAAAPGHDINYIAVTGALGSFGPSNAAPAQPLNLVADYGGGGMLLAFGVLAALRQAQATGKGQIVDCAMTDGVGLMLGLLHSLRAEGSWHDQRGVNLLDGGRPYYDVYETLDARFMAIGAIEPQFYAALRIALELDDNPLFDRQDDPASWPSQRAALAALFKTRTRDEWAALLEDAGACASPVLSPGEAPMHRQSADRGAFVTAHGVCQPAAAPRFSMTPSLPPMALGSPPGTANDILRRAGLDQPIIDGLWAKGIVSDGR